MTAIRMISPIEDAIFRLLEEIPAGKSIDPMNVAKAVDLENWRHRLGHVRNEAVRLAQIEKLVILRHNKPVNPGRFRGVYRLRLPMAGDVVPTADVIEDSED